MILELLDKEGAEVEIPPEIQKEIKATIRTRARAKGMEVEAKEINKQVKKTLLPLLAAYEIKSCTLGGVGKVSYKVSAGRSINEQKLREALLLRGVDAKVINRIIKESSTTWSTEYVDFVKASN